MRVVVADTSPIRYLLQINHIDLLPKLFGNILIPKPLCCACFCLCRFLLAILRRGLRF